MDRPVSSISQLHDQITKTGALMSMIALAIIVITFVYETASRTVFNAPLWWSSELVSYLLCFCTFMMMPYVTGRGAHVAITFVLESVPEQYERIINKVIVVFGLVVCIAMVWITGQEALRQYTNNVLLLSVKPIPKWWISIWIVYGFAGSSLYFLRFLLGERPLPPETTASEAE